MGMPPNEGGYLRKERRGEEREERRGEEREEGKRGALG